MLDEMIKKNKGEKLPENYKKAKLGVLRDISDMAGKAMGDDIKDMKKVSVMAPDSKGLEEGLSKASDMVDAGIPEALEKGVEEGGESEDKGPAGEGTESGAEIASDLIQHESAEGELTEQEIDELIRVLEAKKAAIQK
jgi:hypothetical protein